MTWKAFAKLQTGGSVAFAALAVLALIFALSGSGASYYLYAVFIGAMAVLARWHRVKARRHAQRGDPDPTGWRDLFLRL
jgi:hypothetical protein